MIWYLKFGCTFASDSDNSGKSARTVSGSVQKWGSTSVLLESKYNRYSSGISEINSNFLLTGRSVVDTVL